MHLNIDNGSPARNESTRIGVNEPETSAAGLNRAPLQPKSFGSRRLRILHVFTYLGLGGTELTALRIIRNLDSERFENLVCGLRGFDPEVVRDRCPEISVIAPSSGQRSGPSISSILEVIRKCKPDVVHSRNWGTIESVPAAWLARVSGVIHSEHGYEMETLTSLPARRRIFRRAAYGLADVLFTVTEELRAFHARQAWISPKRIRVIPNGVDTATFRSQPDLKSAVREKLKVPADRFVIGSLGRMVPIKNHVAILKAAEVLLQRGMNAHVLLVGSGPELERYRDCVADSAGLRGRVTFVGATDRVAEVLNAMDVFVLPSFSEGMSNTLLEAMSSGLPVVATRVGGSPEVVEENRSGLLFAPGNLDQLSDCLSQLAQQASLGRALGEAARQQIAARFSFERMVDSYSRLYLEFAPKAGSHVRGTR